MLLPTKCDKHTVLFLMSLWAINDFSIKNIYLFIKIDSSIIIQCSVRSITMFLREHFKGKNVFCNKCKYQPLKLGWLYLWHVFGGCEPLPHVVAEHCGDVQDHEECARDAQQENWSFARAWLHYRHCFFWKTEKEY